jgi:hypothetical protein
MFATYVFGTYEGETMFIKICKRVAMGLLGVAFVTLIESNQALAQLVYLPTPVVSYYRPNPVLRPFTYSANVNYVAPVAASPVAVPYANSVAAYYPPAPIATPTPVSALYVAPTTSYYPPTVTPAIGTSVSSFYAPVVNPYVTGFVAPKVIAPVTSYYVAPPLRGW